MRVGADVYWDSGVFVTACHTFSCVSKRDCIEKGFVISATCVLNVHIIFGLISTTR